MDTKKWINKNVWVWPLLGIILLWIGTSLIEGAFSVLTLTSNINISCFLLIMTLGQAIVLTTGDGAIDLSIPYIVSFVPYFIQLVYSWTDSYILGLIVALLACVLIGVLNGVINIYLRVPAMITTLAVGYIVFSIMMIISGKVAGAPNETIKNVIQTGTVAGIPTRIIIVLVVVVLTWLLLYRTRFGWHLHAVGMNRTAAKFAGIRVSGTVIAAFVITAVLSFIASVMLNGYLGMGGQNVGNAYLLPCVAAAVIGGTSLQGGKSSVMGVVVASIMWTMLNGFLNLALTKMRLDSAIKNLIQGAILILVLVASVPKKQINE